MRRFILVALTAGLLSSFSGPLHAGLGDAEGPERREFDAWCGKKGNNCKVVFTDNSLTVNETDGISRSQMTEFSADQKYTAIGGSYWTWYFTVSYKEDGVVKSGTFLFVNKKAAGAFKRTLLWFCPTCNKVYNPIDN